MATSSDTGDGRRLAFRLRKRLAFATGEALLDVGLCLPPGQWLALQGPSGAGKTSPLRRLAGQEVAELWFPQVDDQLWLDSAAGYPPGDGASASSSSPNARQAGMADLLAHPAAEHPQCPDRRPDPGHRPLARRGGVTLMLGGNIEGRTVTASLDIYNAVTTGDFERAAAVSALLGMLTTGLFILLRRNARAPLGW